MADLPPAQQRRLARVARAAPSARLRDAANAVGVTATRGTAWRALVDRATPRGACDRLLKERAEKTPVDVLAEALRVLPVPYLARIGAVTKGKLRTAAADAGIAGSLARSRTRSDAPRRLMAQACISSEASGRSAAASNDHCPVAMLERLVETAADNMFVASGLASNPRCGPQMLDRLARNGHPHAREDVALRAECWPDTLRHLAAADDDETARSAAVAHPGCPPDAIERAAGDDIRDVRSATATNPNCPPDVIERLADDANSYVRDVTAHIPACPPEIAARLGVQQSSDESAAYLAGLEDIHPVALAALAVHSNTEVRTLVAFNRRSSASTLARLATDPSETVRLEVTNNDNCTAQTLDLLADDASQDVRDNVLHHPHLSEQTLSRLADTGH